MARAESKAIMGYLPIEAKHYAAITSLVAPATPAHRRLIPIPVFPNWTGYLWQAGQHAMLVHPTCTGGDVTLWTVDLDADAWTRLITGGLAQRVIRLL